MATRTGMTAEYRLVVERPSHQSGQRQFPYRKRSLPAAVKALAEHEDHAQRMYQDFGLAVWPAWIETRDVSEWRRLDDEPVEAVPI